MPGTKYEKRIEKYKNSVNQIGQAGLEESDKLQAAFSALVTKIEEIREEELADVERTQAVVSEMTKLYEDCIGAVEAYENKNAGKKQYTTDAREQMRKIKTAVGKDVVALQSYQRAQKESVNFVPKNFETILEEGRAKTMTIKQSEVGTAAAGQSERLVFRDDERGTVFFTESKPGSSLNEQVRDLLEDTKKKYSGKANFMYNNLFLEALIELAANRKALANVNNPLLSQQDRLDDILFSFPSENVRNAINLLSSSAEKEIFFDCVDKVSKIALATGLNQSNGIRQNSKQDKRNSAMSMTAEMLGMGEIIAHSENTRVNFTDAKGNVKKTVMGTGMNQAIGADKKESGLPFDVAGLYGPEKDYRNYSLAAIENNKNFIRDVARLQVLDYICGNPDRHSANLLYLFDKDGKIAGLQGIDNDTSFGSKFKPGTNRSVSINNMQVIPKSTADMIIATDSDTFKLMLYGFDLTKKEIDSAVERFENLKEHIEVSKNYYKDQGIAEGVLINGFPRVVDDDKLGEYSVEQQLAKSSTDEKGEVKHHNTFSLLASGASPESVTSNMMNNNLSKAKDITNDFLRMGALAMQKSALRLQSVDKWYHTGSEDYTTMKKDVGKVLEDVSKYEGSFLVKGKKLGKFGVDFELSPAAKKMKADLKKAIDSTNVYINKKNAVKESDDPKDRDMKNKLADKKSRTYKRYQNALVNRAILEAQYERFVKIEAHLAKRKALSADTKTMNEIKAKDDEARRNATRILLKNQTKNELQVAEKYCKDSLRIINDKTGAANDMDKVKAALEHTFLSGLMPAAEKSIQTIAAEKETNPAQFETFKRGIAAGIIQDKMLRQEIQNRENEKMTNRQPNDNDIALSKMTDVKTENIKNVGDLKKCIDDVMKSETFNTAFNKIVNEAPEVAPEKLTLYTNRLPQLKLGTTKMFSDQYRAEMPEPEKQMENGKENVEKKNAGPKKK